jgi:hypothetical protein
MLVTDRKQNGGLSERAQIVRRNFGLSKGLPQFHSERGEVQLISRYDGASGVVGRDL